jgi:6-phosphogluconolactonase
VTDFADGRALAETLAADVAGALRLRLARQPQSALAVSGGRTPVLFFAALARQDLDWHRVTVMPVDERCVPEADARSNARLIRSHLMVERAAAAAFLSLNDATEEDVQSITPFAAVVLGMGEDGHTASFFPGSPQLADCLAGARLIERVEAPGVPEARLTLTLPVLLGADFLALHVEGAGKRAVLGRAVDDDVLPIHAVLARRADVRVYWCP